MITVLLFTILSCYGVEMKTFTDRYGRIHDVETDGSDPSSDNGWLYSAVAKKLGIKLELDSMAGEYCSRYLKRHPLDVKNRPHVPISRDEILGLAYLGYLKPHHLKGWNFSPFKLPRLNPIKLIKQLLEARGQHRNYFWKNELTQVYHVAFMVPLQDRHFLNKCLGRYNPIYHLIDFLYHLNQPTNRSSRQIRFLKTGRDRDAVVNYYSDKENHPLVIKARQ